MSDHYLFELEPLPYAYDALEPFIDEETMHLHHDNHLQTYINNLNAALSHYPEYWEYSLTDLLQNVDRLPVDLRVPVLNNAGGVYNHTLYFATMTPDSPGRPEDNLATLIDAYFGSFDQFRNEFTQAGLSVFGSGYAWLIMNQMGELGIVTTANQYVPLSSMVCPLLNIDVWEHAYYLKHHNVRVDYMNNWFEVVDWDRVNQNYVECIRRIGGRAGGRIISRYY